MKVRGPTRTVTKLLGALGATPVGMPLPQIPDAMSKGVIDAAVVPWEVTTSVKIDELAKPHRVRPEGRRPVHHRVRHRDEQGEVRLACRPT